MITFHETVPPRVDLEPLIGVACAGCGENRVVMINGQCVSCILNEMDEGLGNDVPAKFLPHAHVPRDKDVVGRRWTS